MIKSYCKPPKPFYEMSITELIKYVGKCKKYNMNKIKKKKTRVKNLKKSTNKTHKVKRKRRILWRQIISP